MWYVQQIFTRVLRSFNLPVMMEGMNFSRAQRGTAAYDVLNITLWITSMMVRCLMYSSVGIFQYNRCMKTHLIFVYHMFDCDNVSLRISIRWKDHFGIFLYT